MKLEEALERVKGKNPNAWAVGKILEEICKNCAKARELIEQDLENKDMSFEKCFEALKKYAQEHQTGGCWACPVTEITPDNEAVKVILEFYKVPLEWITTADADRGTMRAGGEAWPEDWLGGAADAAESQTPRHDAEGQDFDLLNLL